MSIKRTLLPILFALIAATLVTCGYNKSGGKNNFAVCDQKYALCTSAPCVPDPNDPSKAICFCDVEEGKSLGEISCNNRIPHSDTHGVQYITSTYSFAQYATKKTMYCPDGNPWTDCLDMPCTVAPSDPSKAVCQCKTYYNGPFLTLGGNCDKTTCETAFWSAATQADTVSAMAFLAAALGMDKGPENYCPEK